MEPKEISDISELVEIRLATKADDNFIYSTWIAGLYHGTDWLKMIEEESFVKRYRQSLKKLLIKETIRIYVSCLKEDKDVILSYAAIEYKDPEVILHWIFTRPAWRRVGLAKKLLPGEINVVTHMTKIGKSIKPKKWIYEPYLI